MIASGSYGILLSIFCGFFLPHFQQVFRDFKVDIPLVTQVLLRLGEVIGDYYGWIPLVLFSTLLPLLLLAVPPPQQPESRQALARTARLLVMLIYIFTAVLIALALFAPMIALINSVSGPTKK